MKKNLPLAILSGLLLWLAWPPMPYTSFLLFIGFVPMLLAMENIIQSTSAKKGRQIFNLTFIGFLIWNSLSIYWVYNALSDIGRLAAIPITLIPYALGPLLMATACWFYYRLRLYTSRGLGLVGLVLFWIGYEYLHQSWDLNFPWMTLGNGFAVSHQWIQWYEYTGVYGGTVWVWAVNILAFLIYVGLREMQLKTTRIKLIAALVVVVFVPLGISLSIYYNYTEKKNPSNVVVAQPSVDPGLKEVVPVPMQVDRIQLFCRNIAQPNTEFFIWPETAIADYMDEDIDKMHQSDHFKQIRYFLRKFKNATVITGAETYKVYNTRATSTANPYGNNQFADFYNTALAIENDDRIQFYHKSRLVPGAESLPFGKVLSFLKPVFEHLGGATGEYGRGRDTVFYSQSGIGVDPVICYESIWGEYVARSVKMGAQFIAIITNDGWWGNTAGKDQHLDYAKLRAIETRRWVCRSANTGISAFINQRGDIVQHTAWFEVTAIKQDINLNSDITFYVQHGDYIPKTASTLAILLVLFISVKPRLKKKVAVS